MERITYRDKLKKIKRKEISVGALSDKRRKTKERQWEAPLLKAQVQQQEREGRKTRVTSDPESGQTEFVPLLNRSSLPRVSTSCWRPALSLRSLVLPRSPVDKRVGDRPKKKGGGEFQGETKKRGSSCEGTRNGALKENLMERCEGERGIMRKPCEGECGVERRDDWRP